MITLSHARRTRETQWYPQGKPKDTPKKQKDTLGKPTSFGQGNHEETPGKPYCIPGGIPLNGFP